MSSRAKRRRDIRLLVKQALRPQPDFSIAGCPFDFAQGRLCGSPPVEMTSAVTGPQNLPTNVQRTHHPRRRLFRLLFARRKTIMKASRLGQGEHTMRKRRVLSYAVLILGVAVETLAFLEVVRQDAPTIHIANEQVDLGTIDGPPDDDRRWQ